MPTAAAAAAAAAARIIFDLFPFLMILLRNIIKVDDDFMKRSR